MNSRDKFLAAVNFNTGSPVPNWEFAYWYDTIVRWQGEGLPSTRPLAKLDKAQWVAAEACACGGEYFAYDVHEHFDLDEGIRAVPVNMGMIPGFEERVFEQDDDTITYRRSDGKVVKTRKDGTSMPQFLDYPVKSAEDFEQIKERFDAARPDRFPDDWAAFVAMHRGRTSPLQLWGGVYCGFYSLLRELMGVEASLFAFYDNPELVTGILDYFTDFSIRLHQKVLSQVDVDYILIWEDLAFKNGPLVSPALFREFLLPYYKKFTGSMRALGVKHFFVDTDGNFDVLIPLFIEGGITGFYPFEVQAGMDVERVREKYPGLVIMGGIDKMALARGKAAIDCEIAKVERMVGKGGYIPYTDHMVPPDVSFEDYCYFRNRLSDVLVGKIKMNIRG